MGAYTATQKINLIRQYLFPQALTCREGVLRILNTCVPNSAADCLFANYNGGGTTGVYVKTTNTPETWAVKLPVVGEGASRYIIVPATGVYQVLGVNDTAPTIISRSHREIVLKAPHGANTTATVTLYGLRTLPALQAALDDFTTNTGMTIDLLVPRLFELSIYSVITGGTINTEGMCSVVDAVNNSPLNASNLGDATLRGTLLNQGLNQSAPGTYTLLDTKSGTVHSSLAVMSAQSLPTGNVPYAVYTHLNRVEITNG